MFPGKLAGAALAAILLVVPLSAQQLLAGAAKVDITPDKPVALAGYSEAQNRISEGVHDRLYARAVAFRSGSKRLVLVSCDLSGFQTVPVSIYRNVLFERFHLQPDELFLCGTHTHSAPMLILNRTWPHPDNFDYTESLKAKLVQAVDRALNSVAPARIAAGSGESPIAVNRRLRIGSEITIGRNPDGPVDREVQVLKIVRPNGAPIAAIFDYACHARSLRAANRLLSGDIFGLAEQYVEKELGANAVTPAFAGASGDIDPWYVLPGFQEETARMADQLGAEVLRVYRAATPIAATAIRTRTEILKLPGKTPPDRPLEMTVAAIGDVAFLALDCEALVEIGKAIKAASPFRHTFVVTNCNGGSGYLPPAHLYPEGGYEVDLSGFAPEAAGMVVENALKMLRAVAQ
ncbi:MAG TPA: neutral/alkaline non-lysosomal ceramidase N-terminal domain-containing protein [Bryobacteraceae bacterium]